METLKDVKTEAFIIRAVEKHGDKYDYSKSVYTRAQEKILIICKKHNSEFYQSADSHARLGMGCKLCGYESLKTNNLNTKKTTEQFITESKTRYGTDTYNYSKTEYIGKAIPLIITCKKHNEDFKVRPNNHLSAGAGCKACGIEDAHTPFRKSTDEFIADSRRIHGDKFDYSQAVFGTSNKDYVTLVCKSKGHVFSIKPNWHLQEGRGCPKCALSNQEREFREFIISLGIPAKFGDRSVLAPLELDVLIESKKIAFEYNGLYWHSEVAGKGRDYHLGKTISCQRLGYTLVHVLEDEWMNRRDVVKSRIKHMLGMHESKKFARKLKVFPVSFNESKVFLENNHLQGSPNYFKYGYGLFEGTELLACMTFCAPRYKSKKDTEVSTIELLRYATKGSVVGGFSKLLSYFIKNHTEYSRVTSYSDRRWSVGNVYQVVGFNKESTSTPSYDYVDAKGGRYGRQTYMKHKLEKILKVYNPKLSEVENCKNNRLYRIWNCGMDKWVLTLPEVLVS